MSDHEDEVRRRLEGPDEPPPDVTDTEEDQDPNPAEEGPAPTG